MIIFSVGIPGAFTEWCDVFVHNAASHVLDRVALVSANSLDELGLALMSIDAPNSIVRSRHPDRQLQRAIADNARFLLALPNPRRAIEDLVVESGYSLPDAVRAVGSSCASMHSFASTPNALVLKVDHGQAGVIETAKSICDHLGLLLSHAEIEEVVRGLDTTCFSPIDEHEKSVWWEGLSTEQQDLIDGVVSSYSSTNLMKLLSPLIWGRDLFFIGDEPSRNATSAIDVTGRVRCLIYGPYIAVPSGIWTANMSFACSKEVVGMGFMVEILSGSDQLGRSRFQPQKAGVFEVAISFVVEEHSLLPLEMRVFNERAAFDGRLGLGSMTLVQNPSVSSQDRSKISEALGLNI